MASVKSRSFLSWQGTSYAAANCKRVCSISSSPL
uniref:Uncharacterized protein n=1 Tax=Anguilla anguilla TaxID=7936 RepID=A0A0E9TG50_ANGAN